MCPCFIVADKNLTTLSKYTSLMAQSTYSFYSHFTNWFASFNQDTREYFVSSTHSLCSESWTLNISRETTLPQSQEQYHTASRGRAHDSGPANQSTTTFWQHGPIRANFLEGLVKDTNKTNRGEKGDPTTDIEVIKIIKAYMDNHMPIFLKT